MLNQTSIASSVIVLDKCIKGEKSLQLCLFSKELGKVFAYQTIGKKKTSFLIDIFELGQCILEPNKRGDFFTIKDYHLLKKTEGLEYKSLYYLSRWAKLIWLNLDYLEEFESLFSFCIKVIEAFVNHKNPEIIYLKSVYRFLEIEGYPVKEDWLFNLVTEDKSEASMLLYQKIKDAKNKTNTHCSYFINSLLKWAKLNTPLIVENKFLI